MNNNQPLLVDDAALAYLATQIRAYADNAVAEAQQTSVSRSGSKWKDLVDEINFLCDTTYDYDEDVDTLTTALQTKFPDISTGLPEGYISLGGVEVNQGLPSTDIDNTLSILCNPDTITKIDDVAGTITKVSRSAFVNASNLSYVSLPECLTIEDYAFYNCPALSYLYIPKATIIKTYAFVSIPNISTISLPRVTEIQQNAINYMGSLTTIDAPELLTAGSSCFATNTSLTTVNMPKLKTFTYVSPFGGCSSLSILDLPSLEECYQNNSFGSMTGLRSLSVPKLGRNGAWPNFIQSSPNVQHLTMPAITFMYVTMNGASNNSWNNLYFVKISTGLYEDNADFRLWTGTVSWSNTSNLFVNQQPWDTDMNGDPIDCSGFSTNAQKALYCFKNFFMPAFADVTGLGGKTATFKSTIYDVITTDTDITSYFSSHGWTLARIA